LLCNWLHLYIIFMMLSFLPINLGCLHAFIDKFATPNWYYVILGNMLVRCNVREK
jgi:hypothetical protein